MINASTFEKLKALNCSAMTDEFQNQIKQLNSQIQNNNAEKLELEKMRIRIEEQEANDKRDYNNKQIEVKEKQLQVEVAQMYDGNPYNNKIHD